VDTAESCLFHYDEFYGLSSSKSKKTATTARRNVKKITARYLIGFDASDMLTNTAFRKFMQK
jgi:hypothetical protein